MSVCVYNNADCAGRVEWEHSTIYAGRQLNEKWAIIPCCTYHHRGNGLDKDYNRLRALLRASHDDLAKYPRANFEQQKTYLTKKYEVRNDTPPADMQSNDEGQPNPRRDS